MGRRPKHDLEDEFLDLAQEIDASLIVIGLRHRSQVGKFIMGSHAQRILIQADRRYSPSRPTAPGVRESKPADQ